MKTEVIPIDAKRLDESVIDRAAKVVKGGGLVAFPTETVYGIASRASEISLAKLSEIKGRTAEKYYTLHIGRKSDICNYVPNPGIRMEKMIRNFWPGPLTIVFHLDSKDLLRQRELLGYDAFCSLYRDNSIGIRCPDNQIALKLLEKADCPVVAPSANISGNPPAVSAQEVLDQLDGRIDMVLDGGKCPVGKSSTVVKMLNGQLVILREGALSQSELEEKTRVGFLFVCTGNTCRSPMAEGMFKKYLAEKLHCEVDQLQKMGYKVSSAGTMGMVGMPASVESVSACAARGIDISGHCSSGLSEKLVEESDFIFLMADNHLRTVASLYSDVSDKSCLLAGDKSISDPIGQSQHVYDECAEMIEDAVKARIRELTI